MAVEIKIINLRLPAHLKAWLESEATKNLRSLNNEVVFKLAEMMEKQTADRAG